MLNVDTVPDAGEIQAEGSNITPSHCQITRFLYCSILGSSFRVFRQEDFVFFSEHKAPVDLNHTSSLRYGAEHMEDTAIINVVHSDLNS